MEEENVDPSLLRFFAQIRLSMQAVLKDALHSALAHYLEFLLGFYLRDPHSRCSRLHHDIHLTPLFRLPSTVKHSILINNDLELVPLHRQPFLKMAVSLVTV